MPEKLAKKSFARVSLRAAVVRIEANRPFCDPSVVLLFELIMAVVLDGFSPDTRRYRGHSWGMRQDH
ncbi:MAG: hypothetical protein ACYDH4_01995 [Candidatus Cryosericum sp.]